MASDRLAAALRTLVVAGAGAAASWSAHDGLYANTALALLVVAWTGGVEFFATRPAILPPPPPPPVADQDERRRLLAYLDLSPAPLIVREGGALTAVNRAARRLFLTDAVVAQPPPALLDALTQTPPGRTATVTLDDAGSPRTFALAAGELLSGGGVAQVGALIDIGAEIKAAEAAALRELVQVLSHEIVNALTPIASLAETAAALLEDAPLDVAAVREAVTTVARRASGLQRFGDAYRSLARLPAPDRRRIVTRDVMDDLARLFRVRWPDIRFVLNDASAPPVLMADADQLTAALWALLQNAAEASEARTDATVAVTLTANMDAMTVTIHNRGAIIAPDLVEAIFHPFMTTKASGSGVGLALARQIFRGHGGDVRLMGSDTNGTSFAAVLPMIHVS
ncbi:sensor histidine kinase [Sphingomonas sp. Marseille-Q8236]